MGAATAGAGEHTHPGADDLGRDSRCERGVSIGSKFIFGEADGFPGFHASKPVDCGFLVQGEPRAGEFQAAEGDQESAECFGRKECLREKLLFSWVSVSKERCGVWGWP